MDFRKSQHPVNFNFAKLLKGRGTSRLFEEAGISLEVRDLGEDVFSLNYRGRSWKDEQMLPLKWKGRGPSRWKFDFGKEGGFSLANEKGAVLSGKPHATFGVCGKAWILQLVQKPEMRFYGMGEKSLPFERSGVSTRFWNSDNWADFTIKECEDAKADPMYVSIPWMLIKQPKGWVGILAANPYPVFMGTGKRINIASQQDTKGEESLYLGAPDGLPNLFFIAGSTAREVVEKFQRLCGATPLPPLWALGHHQCRWGYQSFKDLDTLDRKFRRHAIPCDGLWLDIDYMDRFKVFTFDKKNFSDPAGQIQDIRRRGRHVVPIIDPGVKRQKGYEVYDDGVKNKVFCRNPEGGIFNGFVWPGATAFPDFTLAHVREWWARRVEAFARLGISGAWLDMNEPALGGVESEDMLFKDGRKSHSAYHNQYALGMAMASREGFLRAQPGKRPFLISRAGFTGIHRFAGTWTGDNSSNWIHLRKSIGISLNLGLSGIPFNGPDVPGFGGHSTPELARDWYKAGFLFPFLRNHSMKGFRRQEPWAFGKDTLRVLRHYIRLRYKLLPYLYNLFIDQEERHSAILRPIFYEFPSTPGQDFDRVDDQFMVGPAIMQAPLLLEGRSSRKVMLPPGSWFDAMTGAWLAGGRAVRVDTAPGETPLYLREGSLLVTQAGEPKDNAKNLRDLELHVFLRKGKAQVDYRFDDGETFGYKKGLRSHLRFHVEIKGSGMRLEVEDLSTGFGGCRLRVVAYRPLKSLDVAGAGRPAQLAWQPHAWRFTGRALASLISQPVICGQIRTPRGGES